VKSVREVKAALYSFDRKYEFNIEHFEWSISY